MPSPAMSHALNCRFPLPAQVLLLPWSVFPTCRQTVEKHFFLTPISHLGFAIFLGRGKGEMTFRGS